MLRPVVLLLCCHAAALSAQTGTSEVPFTWRGQVRAGAWLRVYNAHGPVDVLAADGAEAEVRGERASGARWSDLEAGYQVVRDGDDLVLCVLTEDQECTEGGIESLGRSRSGRQRTPSVAVTIRVPRGVRLSASSGLGEVRVSGATSEVEAHSGNGDVSVEGAGDEVTAGSGNGDVRVTTARGPVSASSGNGRVWVRMETLPAGSRSMNLHTGNGTVTVILPEDFEGEVDARTANGSIDSDFPITTQGRRFSRRHFTGRIGNGGPMLELSTGNGNIELRRLGGGR